MATKKRRRKQLARAGAERRTVRRQQRAVRRRRLQLLAIGVVVMLAMTALVAWIVTHDKGNAGTAGAAVYYDGRPVVPVVPPSIEVIRG